MIDGVAIKLRDGKEWTVPPLTFAQLKKFLPTLQELAAITPATSWATIGAEKIDAIVEMAAAALQQNYPSMTAEKLASLLDLRTVGPVIAALMNREGYFAVPIGPIVHEPSSS
jgi:hypothetical protein